MTFAFLHHNKIIQFSEYNKQIWLKDDIIQYINIDGNRLYFFIEYYI